MDAAILMLSCFINSSTRYVLMSVYGQRFIAALTSEHYFHASASQLGHKEQGHAGGPRNGFVLMPDQLGKGSEEILPAHEYFVVDRFQMLRNRSRIMQLAIGLLRVA